MAEENISREYEEIINLGAERAREVFAAMSPEEARDLLRRKMVRDMDVSLLFAKLFDKVPSHDVIAWSLSLAMGAASTSLPEEWRRVVAELARKVASSMDLPCVPQGLKV